MLRRPVESAQYVSIRYTERLAEAGVEPSVGSVGDSDDNALAETLEALQGFGALDPHSRVERAHAGLSQRVFVPLEPPFDGERDVRSFDRGDLATLAMASSTSALAAGPIPAASCCRMNSSRRSNFKASANDSIPDSLTDSATRNR